MHDDEMAREINPPAGAACNAEQPFVATLLVEDDPSTWQWSWQAKAAFVFAGDQ
jgi:hypothetical protein